MLEAITTFDELPLETWLRRTVPIGSSIIQQSQFISVQEGIQTDLGEQEKKGHAS